MAIPITIHNGNKKADVLTSLKATNIKPEQKTIPIIGNQGQQGTLNGLGLSG